MNNLSSKFKLRDSLKEKEFYNSLMNLTPTNWLSIKSELLNDFRDFLKNKDIKEIVDKTLETIINDVKETKDFNFKRKLEIIEDYYENYYVEENNFTYQNTTLYNAKFIQNDIKIDLQNELNIIVLDKKIQDLNVLKEYKNHFDKIIERLYWFIGISVPSILTFIALIWSGNLLGVKSVNSDGWTHTIQSILIIFVVFASIIIFSFSLIFIIKLIKNIQEKKK